MNPSLDFAFEGFRIIRQKPYAILAWGLILLLGNIAGIYVIASVAGPALHALEQVQAAGPPSEATAEAMLGLFPPILSAYAIAVPLMLIVDSVIACAIYRAALGRESGFAWLALGPAELRQIAVSLMFVLLMIGAMLVGVIGVSLLATPLIALGLPAPAIGFLTAVVVMGAVAALALRLSFFGIQTFDDERINLFGSWSLTRERFWWLATGYVVTGIMVMLVDLLCLTIFWVFAAAFSHGDLKVLDPVFNGGVSMDMFRNPVMIAYMVVANGLVAPLTIALSTGAPAAAYLALKGRRTTATPQDVF